MAAAARLRVAPDEARRRRRPTAVLSRVRRRPPSRNAVVAEGVQPGPGAGGERRAQLRPVGAAVHGDEVDARQRRRLAVGAAPRHERHVLPPQRRAEFERRMAQIDRQYPAAGRATVKDYVDHIDYAVKLIGIDHVGIASDFDGGGGIEGWNSAAETFNVTLELVRRGYTEEQIAKIWSENLLRVWGDVEKVAKQIQAERR